MEITLVLSQSLLDWNGLSRVEASAALTQQAVDEGRWDDATSLWYATEIAVSTCSDDAI